MRRDHLYMFGTLATAAWMMMTYFLFVNRPDSVKLKQKINSNRESDGYKAAERLQSSSGLDQLFARVEEFGLKLKKQSEENEQLLREVYDLKENWLLPAAKEAPLESHSGRIAPSAVSGAATEKQEEDVVIPILMFACNRPTVRKALDPLLEYRGLDPKRIAKFPIIVSQDCNHAETASVIRSYGDQVVFIQQPDQSEPVVPKNEKKFKGYFKIARHYGWALNQTFVQQFHHDQVVIVEDDLEVSPDFFEYFEAALGVLKRDPSLWCVSAWNDNGKKGLIDVSKPELLYRTDFFGGLGWMMTRKLWVEELMAKWPKSYWDDWMRQPAQRKGRACIRPEVGRTKTFGKIGVSNGLFYEKHLKYIHLNQEFYPFTKNDLSYLVREQYDAHMAKELARLTVVPIRTLPSLAESDAPPKAVKVIYKSKSDFKAAVKVLGIMDDSKSGVPRMAYKGVVPTFYKGIRVYLSPGLNWKGYPSS